MIAGTERKLRISFAIGFIIFFLLFASSYAASKKLDLCCKDEYGTIEKEVTYFRHSKDRMSTKTSEAFVENTASGTILVLKLMCFWGEVMLLPCICGIQFTVWYFHR